MVKRKSRQFLISISISVGLALVVAGLVFADHLVIDDFSSGSTTLIAQIPLGGGTDMDSASVAGTMVGDQRDAVMTATGDVNAGLSFLFFRVIPAVSRLDYAADSGVTGAVHVEWDGDADTPPTSTLDVTGLCDPTCKDLTTDQADGIHVEVTFDDFESDLNFKIYTDGSNWSYRTLTLPGNIVQPSNHVDFFLPFAGPNGFSTGGGMGANFTQVGAIVLDVDAFNPSTQFRLTFLEADNWRDYGDLPDSSVGGLYSTAILSASHIAHGLRLGNNNDIEELPNPSTLANGDDNNQNPPTNDEDGVVRTSGKNWTPGSAPGDGGSVDVTIKGCISPPCYLNGWIDWNSDGDFNDTIDGVSEQIISDLPRINNSTLPIAFSIPSSIIVANSNFFARFRLCPSSGTCNNVTAQDVFNGEVEDYYWGFGPTAITLASLTARSGNVYAVPLLVGSLPCWPRLLLVVRRARSRVA